MAALLLIVVAGVLELPASRARAAEAPVEFPISPDLPEELLGPANYQVEPSQVFFGAGGGLFMTGIRWTAWGLPITTGVGKAHVRGRCRPNCANARFHKLPAQLILNRVATAFGHRQYLCWQLAFLKGRRRGRLGVQSCRPGTPATPGQVSYVALGDSYSSGEGVKPFLPGSDTPSDRCHRSAHAYSRQLQFPGVLLLRSFFACSGAVTDNVLSVTQHPPEGMPQLAHPEIGPATNLVTINIGGDDAHFVDVLKKCIIPPACNQGKKRAEILAGIRAVPPRLLAAYQAIKQRAPNATIVVLGYPKLFPPGGTKGLRCNAFQAVARPQQRFLNEVGIELDGLIAQSTAAAGVWYDSVLNAFRDHAICGSGGEWVRGLTLKRGVALPRVDEGSFHPNFAGQRAYATGLRSFLLGLIQAGVPLTPAGLPANPPPR
ncbi:MAG TPA: SGNH/GDSL hydrolase family protein [Solirubrobacterales bacterium]